MPRVSVPNLDSMPSGPPKLVPGEYEVECLEFEYTTSERTGREGAYIRCKLIDGPAMDNGEPVSSMDRPMSGSLWFPKAGDPEKTEKALGSRVKEACEAFDVYTDNEGFDSDDFVGRRAVAVIGPQENKPEYSEIKRFKRV